MTNSIPDELVAAVKDGRAALFLGSGASRGATGFSKGDVPDGQGLADILAESYLTPRYKGLNLKRVYDLCCSQRDVRTVQKLLFDLFDPLEPADFHLLIPTFPWAGLLGTNYDRVIEKAYEKEPRAVKRIEVNTKDGDGATDRVGRDGVLYVKLHGCISRHTETKPPMIASTEQFIRYSDGRIGQFDTFLEWAKSKTIIFCGYSFDDSNLRTLLEDIIAEGDARPRHYIVNKGVLELEADYWRERRVVAIDSTFENLLRVLDQEIPYEIRKIGVLADNEGTSFRRFITDPVARESQALRRYFQTLIEHVPPELDPPPVDAKKFYSGFDLGWSPIAADLDVRQPIVDLIIKENIVSSVKRSPQPLVLIKGHAGSGKTVSLRRICYEAAKREGKLCFFVGRGHIIDIERFEEIFTLSNLPVYLFIDSISHHRSKVLDLVTRADKMKAHLVLIGAETFSTWNSYCEDLEPLVGAVHEMKYLSEKSIETLIHKLTTHNSLGNLKNLPEDKRTHELEHRFGRQILVALLEATHGAPLQEIIVQEYLGIVSPQSRLLYLDICSLHRFGTPVRAGLISRIHNIDFEEFASKFLKPLEQIVMLREDRRSGDFVYEARHSHIADEVYHGILKTEDDRFDNIVRIVGKLNPNFSYDLEVLGKLVRADALENTLQNPARIRQIYDVAESSVGKRPVILHQKGIFEMHQAGNMGQFAVAEALLLEAEAQEPYNRSIKHTLAELDLRRSRMADEFTVRSAWRKSAEEKAAKLLGKGSSPYPHHTLLKASIDAVQDALSLLETEQSEAATLHLGDTIAHAETVLKRGLHAFPNEAMLLAEEGALSKVLSQASRAEKAFEKAFRANPRSTLIAKRLSRIKRAKEAYGEAAEILRECLEYNPGSPDLHYDYALTLMEETPNASLEAKETLLFHLRRSFTPGDRNRQAQFWYARQLSISGMFTEAKELFETLSQAAVPFREKTTVRGILKNADGTKQQFTGSIATLSDDFGFVRCEQFGFNAFFSYSEVVEDEVPFLAVGAPIKFCLGFTLRGPVAVNISL
ncbi:SIR2 family protein [Rhizobium rhizogenes]|uniref:P-loop NTPase n=1 Tax=Rhizobium rhizogenes TaxID=359 RepID=UPI0022C30308|nr:SIR2 family protein [Rhizobium rhizogenes]MCZ7453332.1 SIR2 family protein [Rhizobium rhizogenes]